MRRFVLMMFWPRAVWADLSAHPVPPSRLLLRILLPVAIGVALAHQIGWSWFNTDWSPSMGWSSQPPYGDASLLVVFALAFLGPLGLAVTFAWLAPWCNGRRDLRSSLSVAVWGMLPLMVAACGIFFMPMIVVCMGALVLCFRLCAEGACALLGVPPEDGPELVIGSWLAMAGMTSVAGLLLEAM